jgi:transposase-like protein
VQTCIVHLIRTSLDYASWKDRKMLAAALKVIYQAANEAAARVGPEAFEAGPWARSTRRSGRCGAAPGNR